jgi:phosphoribosylglycinamide formyltransferase-1
LVTNIVVLISGSGSNLKSIIDNADDIGVNIQSVISNKADTFGLQRAKNAGQSICIITRVNYH